MTTALHPFPSFLHPPFGESYTSLPVTRDGVRLVPDGDLMTSGGPAFVELRIRTKGSGAECRGICGLLPAAAFLDGTVRPHEKTLVSRLQRQETAVLADDGALGKPVLLTAPSLAGFWGELDGRFATGEEETSFRGQNNDYKVRQFRSADEGTTPPVALNFPGPLVIADGHHRAETHARLAERGVAKCAFVPVCIIGGDELTIGAFTRVITDERPPAALLPGLGVFFEHQRLAAPEAPRRAGEWLLVCQDACYRLIRKADHDMSIDSEWLDHTVLPRAFGITDTRTDERISFEATPAPTSGLLRFGREAGRIYLCGFPLPVKSFFAEVRAGHCLPPKSTMFEPRVPSGLVVWRP